MRWTPGAIREARLSRNLTQEALAHQLNVTLKTVARWEKGEVEPPGPQADRLDRVLGDASTCPDTAPAPLDPARLAQANQILEKGLEGTGVTLPPERKWEILAAIYDALAEAGEGALGGLVQRLLRLAK